MISLLDEIGISNSDVQKSNDLNYLFLTSIIFFLDVVVISSNPSNP